MGVAIFFPIVIALLGAVLVALFMPAQHLAEVPEEALHRSELLVSQPAPVPSQA